jgi:hypothetical protein
MEKAVEVIVGLSGVWAEEASERTETRRKRSQEKGRTEDLPNRKKTGPS